MNVGGAAGQKPGTTNYMMMNQRQSPLNKTHENNNFMVGNQVPGSNYPKNTQMVGPAAQTNGFKNFQAPNGGYNHGSGVSQITKKKVNRGHSNNYVKNQSVQITGGDDSLGSALTAHEAATFYSSAMNT